MKIRQHKRTKKKKGQKVRRYSFTEKEECLFLHNAERIKGSVQERGKQTDTEGQETKMREKGRGGKTDR